VHTTLPEGALVHLRTSAPAVRVGVDLVEVDRLRRAWTRHGQRFLDRLFTPAEQAYCRRRWPSLAARFAAKEAVAKALGTGLRGIGWHEIEVLSDRGRPVVRLTGRARDRAQALGLVHFALSLSHTAQLAVAFVVATGPGLARACPAEEQTG